MSKHRGRAESIGAMAVAEMPLAGVAVEIQALPTAEEKRFGRPLTDGERAAANETLDAPLPVDEPKRWLCNMEKYGFPKLKRIVEAENREEARAKFLAASGIVDVGDKEPAIDLLTT